MIFHLYLDFFIDHLYIYPIQISEKYSAAMHYFFRALVSSHDQHQGEHQHYQEAASSPGANVDYYQLPGHLYGGAYFHG